MTLVTAFEIIFLLCIGGLILRDFNPWDKFK